MNSSQKHVHVAGIAGIGMSAIAQLLVHEGYEVTGSDRFADQGQDLDVLRRLAAGGIRIVPQDGSALTEKTTALIVSTAIESDNADVQAAQKNKIPIVHRAEMLARLAADKRCIAITGTSGKTTVTGMIGHILECAGWDPTVVNGGVVPSWQKEDRVGNVRFGKSEWWVVEADESDRSLLQFTPDWAVITNISKDHFELDEVIDLFQTFAKKVRQKIIVGSGTSCDVGRPVVKPTSTYNVPMIGEHNAENAATAAALCEQLSIDPSIIRKALQTFPGVQRRLQKIGEVRDVTIIDDYAHNPAKIVASWTAVAETYQRVLGFWRPHGYGPLNLMKNELCAAFAGVVRKQDRLFILPVFFAGGTASASITSENFVALLREQKISATYVADYDQLLTLLRKSAKKGDAILGMGARDPDLPRFAERLVKELISP